MPPSPHPSPLAVSPSPQLFLSSHSVLSPHHSLPEEHCPYLGVYQYPLNWECHCQDHFQLAHCFIPRASHTAGAPNRCLLNGNGSSVSLLSSQVPLKAPVSQHPAASASCSIQLHWDHWTALLVGQSSPLYALDPAQGLPRRGAHTG